ncbi:NAD(P)/FAD-dependent oxidoreductase [Tahibacter harae]|uniref:NADH:ubiquinone reductase (non-electrogenic) n=1 Tax=Tahibacter harae TaxID=2963937 RepID=A0ABT1QNC5_9GAMM|nr:NAD(P)/FAD-dependent oxidoreductase [Tahibacter harae]MCQ4164034.1 NAD(P)/FAD-dependent oxidoreductase [Tahibacter harae]
MQSQQKPHVVIIGGGFGGLWAARALAGSAVRVSLIDKVNHHLFQPLLYQVATAGLSMPDIAAPLRHILRNQANATVLLGEVSEIDHARRQVRCTDGNALDYDYLIVASGARHAYFGHDEWAAHAPGLKTLDDALVIRRQVLTAFERAEAEPDAARRAAWLNFVVIGGGPTGVELAGTLAEIARHTLRREFRRVDPATARVMLVEAGPRVLAALPAELSVKAEKQLQRLGVEVLTGRAVTTVDADGIALGEERIAARSVLWAAGVAASPLGRQLGAPLDKAGRVLVQDDLSLAGQPEIFVIGDLASKQQDGRPLPGVAPVAKQMGTHAARTILARLRGQPARPFRYSDVGSLATIGRMAAVADLGRIRLSGILAWWFWLFVHIFFLIGFRSRLIVLINWAWSYWTYQRHARIIVGQQPATPEDRSA